MLHLSRGAKSKFQAWECVDLKATFFPRFSGDPCGLDFCYSFDQLMKSLVDWQILLRKAARRAIRLAFLTSSRSATLKVLNWHDRCRLDRANAVAGVCVAI